MSYKRNLFFIVSLVILCTTFCNKNSTEPEDKNVVQGGFCKNSTTNADGSAFFIDRTTGEEVEIFVSSETGEALGGMNVQFLDSTGFECFIVEDPQDRYKTSFKIFPHNSMHAITMHLSGPEIEYISSNSTEGQAIENFNDYASSEWIYMDRRTPEQLDAENEFYLFILKLLGIDLTVISDVAGKISEISGSISTWEEPEFYDVYEVIPESPITTTIRILIPVENTSTNTVTDIDGNVYKTVKIGDQWWMAENLKVTHYRNGDPIPNITDGTQWVNYTDGAYCYYNNNSSYGTTYGCLYNWYAVNDTRGIAPEGWHIPTHEEWKTLERFIGMTEAEINSTGWRGSMGTKLKAEVWDNGTNETGFSALPGGSRDCCGTGYYGNINESAPYWSSTEIDGKAWVRGLYVGITGVGADPAYTTQGFAIRCIKD